MRNEIKISFNEPKFHIDEVNKVVVCVLECQPLLPRAIDWTGFNFTDTCFPAKYIVKGVARLNPTDEFDPNVGMKVSLAKAENRAYNTLGIMIKDYLTGLNKAYDQCKDFLWKAANVIEHNEKYLEQF